MPTRPSEAAGLRGAERHARAGPRRAGERNHIPGKRSLGERGWLLPGTTQQQRYVAVDEWIELASPGELLLFGRIGRDVMNVTRVQNPLQRFDRRWIKSRLPRHD